VVECGSGASTVAIARRLREAEQGRVMSLEHDPSFAAATRARLDEERLEGWAVVVDAPLVVHAATGVGWYDRRALDALPDRIELLLVDGPPAGERAIERGRYPALPELGQRLVPGATVILDDASRPGEAWVLARWRERLGFAYEVDRATGIAIGRLDEPRDLYFAERSTGLSD
jgi:predicted O-methyltransferase YrrM